MKYSLRSLMIVTILAPPLLAITWYVGDKLLPRHSGAFDAYDGPAGKMHIVFPMRDKDYLNLGIQPP